MSVPLTQRNLLHQKGKLLLSVTGVAVALTLILLLLGFRNGLYATLTAYVDNLGADLVVAQSGVKGPFSSNSAMPMAIHQDLAEISAAETAHIIVADIILVSGETKMPVLLVGYSPESGAGGPWRMDQGRAVRYDDEVVLDTWLARRNGIATGDEVDVLGQPFTVVGLSRETASWMSPYVFVSQNAAEEMLQLSGIVSFYLLRLPDGADTALTAQDIEAQVEGVEALTLEEIAAADRKVMAAAMDTPINVMLFISLVIGIAVMGLTAYTAAIDRVREYGVLKAIGAGRGWLFLLIVRETLVRAVLGFALGAGLAYLGAELIMRIWPQFTIVILPQDVAGAGAAALVMTVLAVLLPVRRVASVDPAVVFTA